MIMNEFMNENELKWFMNVHKRSQKTLMKDRSSTVLKKTKNSNNIR
jgi:hypothetical protein